MDQTNVFAQENSQPPTLDFFGYIASLAFQAMVFLGEIENPLSGKKEKNLEQAKLLIDTLILLRDKTKGNVSQAEEGLLDSSIYELQLKYVKDVPEKT
ncbi:MAG TPA: DUF1844 domain-containing protein [Candidatus Omnitrophota bacterium]|nr:DUF1844 domain-containing protein [Candidatus Omnitrophota bacterium]HQL40866.1 DUF1844 domain-containing protein [Candidatus Omnitrophota bacterium]